MIQGEMGNEFPAITLVIIIIAKFQFEFCSAFSSESTK